MDRQAVIRGELARIEANPAATDETDADMVDTLVDEFDALEKRRVPLADRAAKLDIIRSTAADAENTERTIEAPEFMRRTDPFDELDGVRNRTVKPAEVV